MRSFPREASEYLDKNVGGCRIWWTSEPIPPLARATLELGCGKRKFEPCLGVDRLPLTNEDGIQVPDFVWDLEKTPWPFARSDSCAFILAHQTLEHINNLIPVMNEIWRIADDNSYVEIITPHYKAIGAYADPTHCRFFTETTFSYWEPGMVEGFSDYGIKGAFHTVKKAWNPEGNLYVLLRPLKSVADLATHSDLKRQGVDHWPDLPPVIDARLGQFRFLA